MDNMIFEDHFVQYAISASWKYQEIHPYSAVNIDSVKINTSLIMMKECPYTDERRDVLENTPPEAQEISRLREISWASGGVFSNTSLLSSVYGPNV